MNKQEEFIKRVKEYEKTDVKMLKKFKITKRLIINNPKKKAGFVARMLVRLLGRMGYVIDTQYHNLKK